MNDSSVRLHGSALHGPDAEIHHRIWQAIIEQALPSGVRLKEQELCDLFGVGRSRIRKILNQLARERVVDIVPHRGAIVATPSVREAREVFRARRLLETCVVRTLGEAFTITRARRLERHLALEDEALARGDTPLFLRLAAEFHLLLAEVAEMPVFSGFLRELVSRTSLITALYSRRGETSCITGEHRGICDALAAGEADAAASLAEQHLLHIEHELELGEREARPVDLRAVLLERAPER